MIRKLKFSIRFLKINKPQSYRDLQESISKMEATMNKQQLAAKIWESANKMRSKIEANEYKD